MKVQKTKKSIVFGDEAREKLVEGVTIMYRAVCATLSPNGRNVAVSRQWNIPIVMHDGVTVARAVDHDDPLIRMGMDLVRQAAQKTVDECGDGTTTATLLAYEIVTRGMKLIKDAKANPMKLRNELRDVLAMIQSDLKLDAIPADGTKDIERVATISSNSPETGKMIADAFAKIGNDGLVTAEESKTPETFIEYTEGMTFDKGYVTNYFVTHPERMESIIENPIIAVIDKKITLNDEIVPLLNTMVKVSKNIVIFGEVSGQALATVVANKVRGLISAVVITPPNHGDRRTALLQDIALMTGGAVFSKELGMPPEDFAQSFKASWLGKASRVVADRKSSMIVKGQGDPEKIKTEIERLRKLKETESNQFEREKLEERLAKLTTGVAVIKTGGKTEIEARENVERVKDAIGAAKSAMTEGIVPGGGKAFLNLKKRLSRRGKKTLGKALMLQVLEAVSRKVMENSGEEPDAINDNVQTMIRARNKWTGYETTNGRIVNLLNVGVIDPAKVIRCTLENGISVATSILTTEVLVNSVTEMESVDE